MPKSFLKAIGINATKFLIYVSSIVSYMWSTMAPERPSYGLTKNAGTALVQQIAKDTPVNEMQVVSFHPGGVLTDMARAAGAREDIGIPFDDGMSFHCLVHPLAEC